jgi:hypothetical protein
LKRSFMAILYLSRIDPRYGMNLRIRQYRQIGRWQFT